MSRLPPASGMVSARASARTAPATEDEWQRWRGLGRTPARRLADETGDEVVYLWPSGGRDPDCPHCS